jgi:hypothetical protein
MKKRGAIWVPQVTPLIQVEDVSMQSNMMRCHCSPVDIRNKVISAALKLEKLVFSLIIWPLVMPLKRNTPRTAKIKKAKRRSMNILISDGKA